MKYCLYFILALLLTSVAPATLLADDTGQQPLKLLQNQQNPEPAVQQGTVLQNLHDIHGPVLLPDPVPYLLYGFIALAVLLILLVAYWWLYKRPKPVAPPIPPGIIARDELMRARELMNLEQTLRYMDRVSEILRHYLESRFQLRSTRQTTREFFQSLTGTLDENLALSGFNTELKHCLERCDMAKFAHQPANIEHLQEMENSVLSFVNQTEHDEQNGTNGGDK